MNTRTRVFFLLLSGSLFLLSSSPALAKRDKHIKMTFEVENGQLMLKKGWFNTTKSNCSKEDHPGCYDIEDDRVGKFELVLDKGDSECGNPDAWKFDAVVLGGEGSVDEPQPKPATWGNISGEAAQDFSADAMTGVVNIIPNDKKRVHFEDRNDHQLSIWYKVSVRQCGSGEILEYDPRIDNRGGS
jgi:hypothetical protein